MRAALIADPATDPARALAAAEAIPAFADPELERWRQWLRVRAARRATPELLDRVLAGVTAWAERARHPVARSSLAGWLGLLRYQDGRFEEAARLHAEAAAGEPWVAARLTAMLNRGSALLETFAHREVIAQAAEARALAAACRLPYHEGRAEWLLRAAAYRMSAAGGPDLELCDAVARLGAADFEALVRMNEAAVALRAGELTVAASLAWGAAALWGRIGRGSPELLARALALAASPPAPREEVEPLAERAARCPVPGVGVQVLGLLGRACPEARASWRAALAPLAAQVPRDRWDCRLDVLSVAESLEAAGLPAGAAPALASSAVA